LGQGWLDDTTRALLTAVKEEEKSLLTWATLLGKALTLNKNASRCPHATMRQARVGTGMGKGKDKGAG